MTEDGLKTLRPAKFSEAAEIVRMIGEYHALDHLDFDPELTRRLVLQLIADPVLGRLFAVTTPESAQAVGYLILAYSFSIEYRGRDAFVDEFYIREEFRGQGLGQQALLEVQKYARESAITYLHLEVERKNAAAMDLYRKVGFKDQDRYLMTFKSHEK